MKRFLQILAATFALTGKASGESAARPVVYNNLEGDGDVKLDALIRKAYAPAHTIVDVRARDGFVEPEPIQGNLPSTARDEKGAVLLGYVLIAYIVDADGLVTEPKVLKSNDARLERIALDAMAQWRFVPAKVKARPVPSTAAQEFHFGPVAVAIGYEPVRLNAYQSKEVTEKRLASAPQASAYAAAMGDVIRRFFVGVSKPETLHAVVILRPDGTHKVWIVSSDRKGQDPAFRPLIRLLEAIPQPKVTLGPVLLSLSGQVAGGRQPLDGPGFANPVPESWAPLLARHAPPPPLFSDAYIEAVWAAGN